MTTSTAGMSFNSPPATERACGFEGDVVDTDEYQNYYNFESTNLNRQSALFNSGKRSSYMNIQNFEANDEVCPEDQMDQRSLSVSVKNLSAWMWQQR